jgi:hypothetical protein
MERDESAIMERDESAIMEHDDVRHEHCNT